MKGPLHPRDRLTDAEFEAVQEAVFNRLAAPPDDEDVETWKRRRALKRAEAKIARWEDHG